MGGPASNQIFSYLFSLNRLSFLASSLSDKGAGYIFKSVSGPIIAIIEKSDAPLGAA